MRKIKFTYKQLRATLNCLERCKSEEYYELKSVCPDWFNIRTSYDEHKKTFLKMVKEGKPRPHKIKQYKLYNALHKLTNKKSKQYDSEFTDEIKSIDPNWLKSKITTYVEHKKRFLKLAKSEKPKPKDKKSNQVLHRLTNKKSRFYDSEFVRELETASPEW